MDCQRFYVNCGRVIDPALPVHDRKSPLARLHAEIGLGVAVTNIPHHSLQQLHILGQHSLLHLFPEDLAQEPPEIFVPRVGKKTSRIGQHAHKVGQDAQLGERVQLPTHSVQLIKEPPATAKLDLPANPTSLEVPAESGHRDLTGGG